MYFEDGEQEDVLRILHGYSDIVIDNINANSIGITIERDDAESFYISVLNRLDHEVFDFRPHHRY